MVEKSRFQRVVLKAANGDESEVEQVKMVGVNVMAKESVQQWRGADVVLWEQVMKKYYGLLADAFEYYGKHTACDDCDNRCHHHSACCLIMLRVCVSSRPRQ